MNKRYLLIFLAAMMAACHPKKEKKDKEKEKAAVDITSFTSFVQTLGLVTEYTYKSALDPIIALHTLEDPGTKYDELRAARLKTDDKVVTVLYYGVRNGHTKFWVTSYNGDGTTLDQVQIGELINEEGQMKHYSTKMVMENDSTIEFRKYYVMYTADLFANHPEKPSEIHSLVVRPNGKLVWKNVVKESFSTYLDGFQKITPPLQYATTTDQKNFYKLIRGSSWFDFGGFLHSNYPSLYMVGKVEISGKPPMVLLKVEDLDAGEDTDSFGPSMILIAYDAKGNETDRMQVTGSYAAESFQTATSKFNMDVEGNISLIETASQGDASEGYTSIDDTRELKCELSPAGRFIRTYTAVRIAVKDFDAVRLRGSQATSSDQLDYLGSLEDWNLSVLLHTSQDKSGKVIRLITANNSGRVLGTVVLHNTMGNDAVKPLESISNDYIRQEVKGTLNGSVTIDIAGKTYMIAKDGNVFLQ